MKMEYAVGSRERIYLYDNVRFILICLVVVGHALQIAPDGIAAYDGLDAFIYSFHMPAFIFLAGLFHKNERIIPKVVAYVFIGFLMKVGFFLGNILISEVEPLYIFQFSSVPWYIFVLAGYTAVSYVLRDIDKRFLLLVSLVFGCFAGYDQTIGHTLGLSRGIVFYPFYLLGQACDRGKLASVSCALPLRLTGAFILTGWLAICSLPDSFIGMAFRPVVGLFLGSSPFDSQLFPWGAAWRALHYTVSLLACLSLICLVPDRPIPLVSQFGSRTLQIYFWHWPIVRLLNALTGIGPLLWTTGPGRAIWLLAALAVTFILGLKPFSFPTAFILQAAGCRPRTQPSNAQKTVPLS